MPMIMQHDRGLAGHHAVVKSSGAVVNAAAGVGC